MPTTILDKIRGSAHSVGTALVAKLAPPTPPFSFKENIMTPDPTFTAAPVAAPIPAPIVQPVGTPVPHVVAAPVAHVAAVAPVPATQGMNHALATVTNQVVTYMPTVMAAIVAAENIGAGASGAEKAGAVISAVTQSLGGSANANVAGIAALVNLGVMIANLLGVFRHKAPAAQ